MEYPTVRYIYVFCSNFSGSEIQIPQARPGQIFWGHFSFHFVIHDIFGGWVFFQVLFKIVNQLFLFFIYEMSIVSINVENSE